MPKKKLAKSEALYRKRQRSAESATKKLVAKALKNGVKFKPAKGYKFLKNCNPGDMFATQGGIKGILVDCTVNASVIIYEVPDYTHKDDSNYYLGKHIIGAETEVKVTHEKS